MIELDVLFFIWYNFYKLKFGLKYFMIEFGVFFNRKFGVTFSLKMFGVVFFSKIYKQFHFNVLY